MTVQVVLPLPLDEAYTYLVPESLQVAAKVGCRVLVPFGPRQLTGVVVGHGGAADGHRLKPILDVLDEEPSLTSELLRLTRWIADYYVCSWGEKIKAALPSGREEKDGRPPQVRIKKENHLRLAPPFRTSGAVRDLKEQLRGAKQIAIVETLADVGETGLRQADVLAEADASAASAKALMERGIVEQIKKEVMRSPLDAMEAPGRPTAHVLNGAQQAALAQIEAAIEGEAFQTFLLHGITGSGKTEVYIAALRRVLEAGKTGIILVPEIALTPQTVRRFRAPFGDQIAVLHSRMSLGERYDAWRHLRSGRFTVAIGPRSAVLAPLENLGLIVVDEEHESSYKQFDPAPRYHARDVAVMRAAMNRSVCVLGSATPSLESFANAQSGKYTLLEMPERVPVPGRKAAALPDVRVVDLTLEKKKHRLEGALSEPLAEAIRERLGRGEQTILLQNRRGYAPVIECAACGWSPLCRDCSVTLTYHKAKRHLRCHYCGRTARLPQVCPKCDAPELTRLGMGTQRVEEELAVRFPGARVLRMDLDTTSRKGAHHRLLGRFRRGEADVLLGTQMVAKGLDFPNVTLVGVVNADAGMLLPDFRSEERTFQLLTQVAGRAGRAELKGEVIFQTRNPEHAALRFATTHDYAGFAGEALPERKVFGYPPFGRVVGVEFRG
ncbi:MAG: replication restart helicase PriA, partial [Rhodothermales bacterium]